MHMCCVICLVPTSQMSRHVTAVQKVSSSVTFQTREELVNSLFPFMIAPLSGIHTYVDRAVTLHTHNITEAGLQVQDDCDFD